MDGMETVSFNIAKKVFSLPSAFILQKGLWIKQCFINANYLMNYYIFNVYFVISPKFLFLFRLYLILTDSVFFLFINLLAFIPVSMCDIKIGNWHAEGD